MKKIKLKKPTQEQIVLLLILFIYLVTRIYRILSLPKGIHIDEMSMAYNTWSLSKFGVDRYNLSYPVYFDNAGSGQSGLFVYLATLISKVTGYHFVILRLLAVASGIYFLLNVYNFCKDVFNKWVAYVSAICVVIMPYFIMSQRWALDCNFMLPCMSAVLLYSFKLYEDGRTRWVIGLGVACSLTMYSYALAWLVVPMFLFFYAILYTFSHRERLKQLIKCYSIYLILCVPLILYALVLFGVIPEIRTNFISITKASANRLYEVGFKLVPLRFLFKDFQMLFTYDSYKFSATSRYGTIYSFGFVLVILGFVLCCYQAIKNKNKEILIIIVAFLCNLSLMFIINSVSIYRFNSIYLFFVIFESYAIVKLFDVNKFIPLCIMLFLFSSFASFYAFYLTDYSKDLSNTKYFTDGLYKVSEDLTTYKKTIYVDSVGSYNPYLELIYGLKVPPNITCKTGKILEEDDMNFKYKGNHFIVGLDDATVNEDYVYVLKDLNQESLLYSNTWKNDAELVSVNKELREKLESLGFKSKKEHGYVLYYN